MSLFKTLMFKLMKWMDTHKSEYDTFKASYDTHIVDGSAHHSKYTDAEAVAAADASDKFVERNIENICSDITTIKRSTTGTLLKFISEVPGASITSTPMKTEVKSTNTTYLNMLCNLLFPAVEAFGTDTHYGIGRLNWLKLPGVNNSYLAFYVLDTAASSKNPLTIRHDMIELQNIPIKNIKNHAASALSGTKKVVEIMIGPTPYYFEVYPTKA